MRDRCAWPHRRERRLESRSNRTKGTRLMALVDPNQAKLLRKDRGTDLRNLWQDLERTCGAVNYCCMEYKFHPSRKWRFDLAIWPSDLMKSCVALEVQGGIWTRGRHTRGAALLGEMEKLNAAAAFTWRVVYCTPADVRSGKAKEIILACL